MGELVIYSLFFGLFFFLFPIFVYVDGYTDAKENKFWFSVSLYRFFRVFGGYIQVKKEGLIIHLTKKKAVLVPYAQMADTRQKFEITKGFQLWRYHQIVETGGANSPAGILIAASLQAVSSAVFSVLKTAHPFLSLRHNTLLTEKTELKISLQLATVFNGLVLTIAIVKKLLEAILNWIKEKKSTALWKKRRSSSPA